MNRAYFNYDKHTSFTYVYEIFNTLIPLYIKRDTPYTKQSGQGLAGLTMINKEYGIWINKMSSTNKKGYSNKILNGGDVIHEINKKKSIHYVPGKDDIKRLVFSKLDNEQKYTFMGVYECDRERSKKGHKYYKRIYKAADFSKYPPVLRLRVRDKKGQTKKPAVCRILWDQYEAAFLLDACLRVNRNEMKHDDAVRFVSQSLRQRAIDNGMVIDDIFRNENGIDMQMSSMIDCLNHREGGLTISKAFRETVNLYETNQEAFYELLNNSKPAKKHSKHSVVNFFDISNMAYTKPVTCTYGGVPITFSGWNDLYIKLVKALHKDYPGVFSEGLSLFHNERIDIGNPMQMIYPKEIGNHLQKADECRSVMPERIDYLIDCVS